MESQDLVMVADKMARSILGIPQIANAPTPPTIVLEPVDNQTRFPINKEIFLTRIRAQLNSKATRQGDVPGAQPDGSAGEGAQPASARAR